MVELTLMDLPLELRHQIFESAAARPEGDRAPKKILRRWFEKEEVNATIAAYTGGETLQAVYDDPLDYDGFSDEDDEDDEDEDGENSNDGGDEDGDEEDDDDDTMEEDDDDDTMEYDEDEDEDEDEADQYLFQPALATGAAAAANVTATVSQMQASVAATAPLGGEDGEEEGAATLDAGEDAAMADDDDDTDMVDADESTDMVAADSDGTPVTGAGEDSSAEEATAATTAPSPPIHYVRPHRKWRHIPNFLTISACPPPVALLQTSKELKAEALDWYYDITVMRIDATGSFAHTSMFEEALHQIANAAHSPFENIRKVQIRVVWDTEWLRGPDAQDHGFLLEAMLDVRVDEIVNVLRLAPNLAEITLQWHDSIQDDFSAIFKNDIYQKLTVFPVTIKMDENYLTPGEKPRRKTLIGKKRLELQEIADSGFAMT